MKTVWKEGVMLGTESCAVSMHYAYGEGGGEGNLGIRRRKEHNNN
jgi:hypothetical protein